MLSKKSDQQKLLDHFKCPFTTATIRHPVLTNDGHYWELSGLIAYIRHCRVNNQPIKSIFDSKILLTTATYSYEFKGVLDKVEKSVDNADRAADYSKQEALEELKKLLPDPKLKFIQLKNQSLIKRIKPPIYGFMGWVGVITNVLKFIQTSEKNQLAYSQGYYAGCENAKSDVSSSTCYPRQNSWPSKGVDSYSTFAKNQYNEYLSSIPSIGGFIAAFYFAHKAGQTGKLSYLFMALAAVFFAVQSGRLMTQSSSTLFGGVGYATGYDTCFDIRCTQKNVACYSKQLFFASSELPNDDLVILGLISSTVILGYLTGYLSRSPTMTINYGDDVFVQNNNV